MSRAIKRAVATEFVKQVNRSTVCVNCGAQPVDWHHDDHPQRPNSRVSSLRAQGASIPRIQREMDRCTPLCRKCHMQADGRAAALFAAQPNQPGSVLVPPLPCVECGKPAKPRRKHRCYSCYERQRCGGRMHRGCDGCC